MQACLNNVVFKRPWAGAHWLTTLEFRTHRVPSPLLGGLTPAVVSFALRSYLCCPCWAVHPQGKEGPCVFCSHHTPGPAQGSCFLNICLMSEWKHLNDSVNEWALWAGLSCLVLPVCLITNVVFSFLPDQLGLNILGWPHFLMRLIVSV